MTIRANTSAEAGAAVVAKIACALAVALALTGTMASTPARAQTAPPLGPAGSSDPGDVLPFDPAAGAGPGTAPGSSAGDPASGGTSPVVAGGSGAGAGAVGGASGDPSGDPSGTAAAAGAGDATRGAAPARLPVSIRFGGDDEAGSDRDLSTTIQILILMTVLTLTPALLLTMTSFTRIIIVLSFLRRALATQELPPNQIMVGIALFLTLAVMSPILVQMHEQALDPYLEKEISMEDAGKRAGVILSDFLLKQTRETDLALIYKLTREAPPRTAAEVPLRILVPAFVLSELKTAFQIGFVIFLPFLVIDMAVASILLSMGMFMLPPIIISTPFKILLFILVDGWYLVVQSLFRSFS